MKQVLLICSIFLAITSGLHAQGIRFEKDSLRKVFAQAKQQNKPVFVVLASPPPPANLSPQLKEARNKSGLNDPAVAAELNKEFLSKEVAFGSLEGASLVRQYTVTQYPTYLYFAADGSLLCRSMGNASQPERYLKDVQAAHQAQADPQNLSYYQREFANGNRSADFLKHYLLKRQQLGQVVEPALLDTYAEQLPAKTYDQAGEVVFIMGFGPVVGSKAFKLTRLNQKLIDSLYKALPLAQRITINNLIIRNTMRQAEATKDRNLAGQGASFASNTWTGNHVRGQRTYEDNMLAFYRNTKDTTSYLRQAVSYYERYFMNISADSARKVVAGLQAFRQQQQVARQRLDSAATKWAKAKPGTTTTTSMRPVAIGSAPSSFITELNNGAWAVYQTGTHTRDYLSHALQWSKRTVDLDPAAYNYDTLAHLLYRLGFYEEAEAREQQAATLAQQEKASPTGYKQELEKMRKRTL
jgi:tetratricopeptide (TPR) repeat protein